MLQVGVVPAVWLRQHSAVLLRHLLRCTARCALPLRICTVWSSRVCRLDSNHNNSTGSSPISGNLFNTKTEAIVSGLVDMVDDIAAAFNEHPSFYESSNDPVVDYIRLVWWR